VCSLWLVSELCCSPPSSFTLAGAQLFGDLLGGVPDCSSENGDDSLGPQGVPIFAPSREECLHSNDMLLQSLREDEHSKALHHLALDDCALGRMSVPVPVEAVDLAEVRLVPRFGVVQGVKPDGQPKLRAVDHMSWSAPTGPKKKKRTRREMKMESVNGHVHVPERVTHDHLDRFLALLILAKEVLGTIPHLWKADVDAAFRRVPLDAEHVWAAGKFRNCCTSHAFAVARSVLQVWLTWWIPLRGAAFITAPLLERRAQFGRGTESAP
jgi:hypothetical protein